MVTIIRGENDCHVEEYGNQNQMAWNPLERVDEDLGKDAGKTKTSRSGTEVAALIFLNYNLNVIWRLL